MTGNKMISRRQIIRCQQEPVQEHGGQQTLSTSSSSSTNQSGSSNKSAASHGRQVQSLLQRGQQHQSAQQSIPKTGGRKLAMTSKSNSKLIKEEQQQPQDSSDGYIVNHYDEYADERHQAKDFWRHQDNGIDQVHQEASGNQSQVYRHFDPYSIYAEEDDVWYSEERLFEDHLEEIFNKWQLLDDDIWCKLIIMERNRRIGKAWARIPLITIDGSHELSYDGYKLALNGFDNPDRDSKTEECRKRIGKGIRIKMDNFGNILIKRLSKSGVYIKEWIQSSSSGGSSNSTSNGRAMPSRQQLIKNQNAMLVAMNNNVGGNRVPTSSLINSVTPSSSMNGSSIDPPNDSAICDEVINVGGRLDQDKIYVLFDMKKFQANITQELCRPYPDKRKLEQQCFSIVGLTCDAEDILNLPCWVMVINIVAIEMLNERFPLMTNHTSFPDTMLLEAPNRRNGANQAPNFVSIFEQNHINNNNNNNDKYSKDGSNKEEDPYSLPANASSSDVKSSINDYSTTSTKNISSLMELNGHQVAPSRYYGTSKRAEMYAHKKELSRNNENSNLENIKHRSKSNCNIYGTNNGSKLSGQRRYNNSSSIYSPGHMLVPPSMPPKLPPRDFIKKGKSKSSSNVNYDLNQSKLDQKNENIYFTDSKPNENGDGNEQSVGDNCNSKVRQKTKKNRFLESLKAPLELAKSNRSASVVGAPIQSIETVVEKKLANKPTKGFTKSSAKNLKSLLGARGNGTTKDTVSDDNNYVHLNRDHKLNGITRVSNDGVEVDSVVDSNEDIDDVQQMATNHSSSVSYNDLDIPTPDYETDENIYAIEANNYRGFSSSQKNPHDNRHLGGNSKNLKSSKPHNKDDLYYSGFRAHIPQNIGTGGTRSIQNGKSILEDKMSCVGSRENSRFAAHNKMMSSKMSGRDMIYGSTTGLPSMVGSRYRSASMQRYYPRSQPTRSQAECYELEPENPYLMNNGTDMQGQYGVTGHQRRSASKMSINPFGVNSGALHRVTSSMANSNYDIGRSSSGIYGNNSSSSSSDYADWHPQMRKVNSSGYLNSIFKNHITSPVDSFNTNALNNNNLMASHDYNNKQQQRNYASRTLKSARQASTLSKQQQQHQNQYQQKHQMAPSIIPDGPNYRSYDSSNDSEPSYTNSSDGLDIYDHIGAHARLNHHHPHHQFSEMPAARDINQEVHVGEWENMYDR